MKNKYLTRTQDRILRIMAAEEEELLFEKGAGWWIGCNKTNGKVAMGLLRLCLVKEDGFPGPLFRLYINGDGRKAIKDPDFKPPILDKTWDACFKKQSDAWEPAPSAKRGKG